MTYILKNDSFRLINQYKRVVFHSKRFNNEPKRLIHESQRVNNEVKRLVIQPKRLVFEYKRLGGECFWVDENYYILNYLMKRFELRSLQDDK
ncbi:hypothetical protein ABEG63_02930 [Chryseobacterium sp. C39-AII1]|uniref:hypothetical protein n=1 Tax=Chryseobacterium sp. C39-AII1 TaxID=3080332 RepID=UPI003209B355